MDVLLYAIEIGSPLIPMWERYFKSHNIIMFVVDVSSPSQMSSSLVELYLLLAHKDLKSKPFVVVFNKIDLPYRISSGKIKDFFSLEDLEAKLGLNLFVTFEVSSLTGENVNRILEAIVKLK